jgi:membrane-bound serine protease (ClpP class)
LVLAFLVGLLLPGLFFGQASAANQVVELKIEGAIGPANEDYLRRAFEDIDPATTELILIRMDTPGGLDSTMRDIVKLITASSIPVVTYVSPTGARAASAGTYILYASHIAAMAPGTNLGAATPVQIGGFSPAMPGEKPEKEDEATSQQETKTTPVKTGGDTMQHKLVNDAVAYIRGLAELHGRNADWAEKAVRESVSLPASEALEFNVIDIIASDIPDLLQQLNGREIKLQKTTITLQTENLQRVAIEPDWRSRLLSVITSPNVAYILLLAGIYGLILEFTHPGALLPGTIGAISLVLALYAFQLLPINYAGAGLILLGVALMIGEAFQPSFGVLGLGGIAAFIFGSIILMDTHAPGFAINLGLIIAFAVASAAFLFFLVGMAIRARQRPVVSGQGEMLGLEAVALEDFSEEGNVRVHGEIWRAHTQQPVRKHQHLQITAMKGLMLEVMPASTHQEENHS